jgi:hypothetical protein
MLKNLISLACLVFLSSPNRLDLRETSDAFYLSAPDLTWELMIPREGWDINVMKKDQSGRSFYYMFSNPEHAFHVSFFIEPAEICKTSEECREMYWDNPGPLVKNPQEVQFFSLNDFSIVKYVVPEISGVKVDQLNYSCHLVRDDYWIDLHISKLKGQVEDESLFSEYVNSISIKDKTPIPAFPSRPFRL